MSPFDEKELMLNCPHCDTSSFALKYPLQETRHFWIICDVHPLTRGHILIMPKNHYSCFGAYPQAIQEEFQEIYKKCSRFLIETYGSVSSFEHGKIGQTVFHSHIQMFPFSGSENDIVPEGPSFLTEIEDLDELINLFIKNDQYLFFSIGNRMWTVDTRIGKPRFFRDRFAGALHHPERGNWKLMHENKELMDRAEQDMSDLMLEWKKWITSQL